jgi:hypothetical protein
LKCKECRIHFIHRIWQSQISICLILWSKTAEHRCKWWRRAEKWNFDDFPGNSIGRTGKVIQSLDRKMPVGRCKCRKLWSIRVIKRNIDFIDTLLGRIQTKNWLDIWYDPPRPGSTHFRFRFRSANPSLLAHTP